MSVAYVVVTLLTIAANLGISIADVCRAGFVVDNSASVRVPESWLYPLAALKTAGALGLLVGLLGFEPLGIAAAIGLTLFFVGAVIAHLRARNYALHFPLAFLALAVGSLVLTLLN